MLLTRITDWYIESDVALATGMDEDSTYPDYQGGAEYDVALALGCAMRCADLAPRGGRQTS